MNRFDLEQEIMKCWNVTDDLESMISMRNEGTISDSEFVDVVTGIKVLYEHKFNKLFNIYSQLVKENQL